MKLTSCSNCKVVIDVNDIDDDPDNHRICGCYDLNYVVYRGSPEGWVVFTYCPVCEQQIIIKRKDQS